MNWLADRWNGRSKTSKKESKKEEKRKKESEWEKERKKQRDEMSKNIVLNPTEQIKKRRHVRQKPNDLRGATTVQKIFADQEICVVTKNPPKRLAHAYTE